MDALVREFGYFDTAKQKPLITSSELSPPLANKEELLRKRKKYIGSKCQMFYKSNPFVVSRAFMQYIYDETGKQFIDCISNVQHVGHCHPNVVNAITKQLSLTTCNLRFVNSKLTECAEELLKTVPGLDTVLFCNSGSEANDLALQLARDFTRHNDAIVLEHAYHGHVTTTMQMSPYKFDHGSAIKKPDWVHVAPCPDVYRGKYRLKDEELLEKQSLTDIGKKYSEDVKYLIEDAQSKGRYIAAYFAEALQSCGGQIIPPPEYFCDVAKYVRKAGGLMIMDEIQTGFGRVGSTFWAHQLYKDGFIADIVTLGKPMGNGYPVSAVITRKEIADALCDDVDYFNTYGGNPVACASVLGVLSVLESENLLEHSQHMGELFEEALLKLKIKHEAIGDVRGVGLFWGIDIIQNAETRDPDSDLALEVVMELRQKHNILINADGPYKNILKIKPPLCFNEEDLTKTVAALDKALTSFTSTDKL